MWHGPFGTYGWVHDQDEGRQGWLAHYRIGVHGIPRAFTCRLFGHRPVVDGYGNIGDTWPGGHPRDVKRWVACGRCDERPAWQGDLPPALFPKLGASYEGEWVTPLEAELRGRQVAEARDRYYREQRRARDDGSENVPYVEPPNFDLMPAWPSTSWSPRMAEQQGPRGAVNLTVCAWARKWSGWPGIGFEVSLGDGETPIDAHVHLAKLGAVYLGLERYGAALAARLYGRNMPETRRWGVELSGLERSWSFQWKIAATEANRRTWRYGYIDLTDKLLGKVTVNDHAVDSKRVTVPLPEGGYPATVELRRVTRRRPRTRMTTLYRYDITPDVAIPEPGKGENSWDIDDDATYSQSGPCAGPDSEWVTAAVTGLAQSVMRQRERYGSGQAWVPDRGWPEGLVRV